LTELKYLACSDIQFPLQDERALNLWIDVLRWFKPDLIDFVGDIDNADSTSRWAAGSPDELFWDIDLKKISYPDLVEHVKNKIGAGGSDQTRELLGQVRSYRKNADIHLFDGNHGWHRHHNYLFSKYPQLLETFTPDYLYGLNKYGINWHFYDELPYNRFNDMYVHHGESVSKHSGESVKADMENWGVSLIRGHSHRVGDYHKTFELTGKHLEGYEIGHLMDVKKADYTTVRNWQQGFLYGYISEGQHHLTLVKIKDYECYVAGKKFSA
jgi:hypothetical protein